MKAKRQTLAEQKEQLTGLDAELADTPKLWTDIERLSKVEFVTRVRSKDLVPTIPLADQRC